MMNFPHEATLQTLQESGGKSTYTDSGTSKCFLQPLSAEQSQLYGVTFGKAFNCFLPYNTAVQEKMRVIINGTTYGVQGMQSRDYGALAHKRLILQKV